MIFTSFATLPHPFKGNGNKAQTGSVGRTHPPLGRVGLPTLPEAWQEWDE